MRFWVSQHGQIGCDTPRPSMRTWGAILRPCPTGLSQRHLQKTIWKQARCVRYPFWLKMAEKWLNFGWISAKIQRFSAIFNQNSAIFSHFQPFSAILAENDWKWLNFGYLKRVLHDMGGISRWAAKLKPLNWTGSVVPLPTIHAMQPFLQ